MVRVYARLGVTECRQASVVFPTPCGLSQSFTAAWIGFSSEGDAVEDEVSPYPATVLNAKQLSHGLAIQYSTSATRDRGDLPSGVASTQPLPPQPRTARWNGGGRNETPDPGHARSSAAPPFLREAVSMTSRMMALSPAWAPGGGFVEQRTAGPVASAMADFDRTLFCHRAAFAAIEEAIGNQVPSWKEGMWLFPQERRACEIGPRCSATVETDYSPHRQGRNRLLSGTSGEARARARRPTAHGHCRGHSGQDRAG